MYTPTELFLSAVQTAVALLGFITNGFVVAINLWDWKFCRALSTSDYFIFSVGLSNLSLQLWSGFNWFCNLLRSCDTFCQSAYALKMISTHCSFKVGGFLCMFYCTKIVMSKNWVLRFYQRRLKSFRTLILRTTTISFILGIPLFVIKKEQLTSKSGYQSANFDSIFIANDTLKDIYFVAYRVLLLSIGYTYPLLLSFISAASIIISLVKHVKKMRDSMEKKHGVFIDAHQRACVTILSLLILIFIYFVTSVIILISVFPEGDVRLTLCEFISTLYAPVLGIVLIRGNSKLRKAATRIRLKVVVMFRLHK